MVGRFETICLCIDRVSASLAECVSLRCFAELGGTRVAQPTCVLVGAVVFDQSRAGALIDGAADGRYPEVTPLSTV